MTLAERLGVSESFIRRRVARLTEADVFSITAVADPRVLGIDCMAWIGVNTHPARAAAVADTLVSYPEIDYVVQTSGAFSVMAEAACRSAAALYELIREVRTLHGVQKTETFIYLNLLRQQFQWSLDGARQGVRGGRLPRLDRLDVALIRELQRNGRASFRDLAGRLSVSERTVSTRVARMISDNVLQIIAVGNPLTLGFEAMAWLGIRVAEGARIEQTAASLADVPGIDYVVLPAGRYDLMAELVCRDQTELLNRLQRGVGAIDGISDVESFLYLRLLYKSTIGAWGAGRSRAINPAEGA
jgi:DNA-binding Lrp family transcriptional regulator